MYYKNNRRQSSSFRVGRSNRNTRNKPKKSTIHHSMFVKRAKEQEITPYQPNIAFDDMQLHPLLKDNLKKKQISLPSQIQEEAIPVILKGHDVLGIANTGTGKTLAFALPVLNALLIDKTKKVLILAPTRELAEQIEQEMKFVAKGSGLKGALIIGGASMHAQLQDLRQGPQVIIGTPGRVKDHLKRGTLDIARVSFVVLDEVDRMLDMGFKEDMNDILSAIVSPHQSLYFSATIDQPIASLVKTYSPDHMTISVKRTETSDLVDQDIVHFNSDSDKIEKLHTILISQEVAKTLIFNETKRGTERLYEELQARGFAVESIHGDKTQQKRTRALKSFKSGQSKVLVATDVAARGIDVSDITHVINYTVPQTYEDYVHRIGRAGRAGRKGYSLTFVKK